MRETINNLSNLFRCGRISGWVSRNRDNLPKISDDELKKLGELSPLFQQGTRTIGRGRKIKLIQSALRKADQSPLSSTRRQ